MHVCLYTCVYMYFCMTLAITHWIRDPEIFASYNLLLLTAVDCKDVQSGGLSSRRLLQTSE
jgi:hypothetical protein